jgi:hypothetical protein
LKIKSQRDFWAGMMFLVAGIVFAVGARNYSLGTSARPGPGYFPLMLSVIMAILGAIEVFKALTIESEGGDPIGDVAWKPLIVIVAAIAVFAVTISWLGMIASIPILIAISSFAGDEFHWRDVLINAVVLTIASWLIFIVGLKLTIPMWPSFIGA